MRNMGTVMLFDQVCFFFVSFTNCYYRYSACTLTPMYTCTHAAQCEVAPTAWYVLSFSFLLFINYYYMPSVCTHTPPTSSSPAINWPVCTCTSMVLQVCFILFYSLTTYYTTFAHSLTAATIPTTHNHLDTTANGGHVSQHHPLHFDHHHHPHPHHPHHLNHHHLN